VPGEVIDWLEMTIDALSDNNSNEIITDAETT